jgi:hypothetical protein
MHLTIEKQPVPMAARSKARLLGLGGSNPAGGMHVSLASGMCFQVEVSTTDRSLVQRSTIECERVCSKTTTSTPTMSTQTDQDVEGKKY